jgi:apolipoprotein N-acyltransferase
VLEAPALRAPLGLVALAPLFACVARTRPGRAALLAAVWTLAATSVVASWFPSTLMRFFGLGPAEALLGGAGLALLVNLPPYLLLAVWLAWRAQRGPVAPVVVGAAWLLAELARARGAVPNPYALAGISQVGAPTDQVAEAVGVFGLGALVATAGALAAALVVPSLRGPRPRRDLAVAAALPLLALGFGAWRLGTLEGSGTPVRVAVVQPGPIAGPAEAPDARRLDVALRLSREALATGPDLLFWPESAVAFYPREDGAEQARFLREAAALGTDLVFGAPHYRRTRPATAYHASLFLLRDGALAGRYDKLRLVPFAEYDPLGPVGGLLAAGAPRFQPGRSARPLEARAASVGGFLCGEVLFPDVARRLAAAGATLLANPSNDAWLAGDAPARHQLRAAQLRAIENRRAVVRATRDGYSAVIDARGRLLARSGRGQAERLVADVRLSRRTTFHQRAPEAPWAASLALVAASSLGAVRRRPQGDHP